ncbi:heparan sulfate 2-O-sulfotransferase 1-like [Bradysia coprophila]|uniref:heparan sulfate 2-O-sulfotransferase 1-like n=1 Tax=Bradysia coprophila TaxID=38358 RepID=UPI00187D6F44|nr:heparan sulfate 2-O-sulfotransferase 1-like [Bradysia coprophila]
MVINFDITKSVVPVLTSDICAALPNILTFAAVAQGIEIVEDFAFVNCTMVTSIRIHYNNIHKLGKGIFSTTKLLQALNIHGASLEATDMVELLSNLSEMVSLVLSANGLTALPVEAVKNMKKLKYLYLYSNNLSELDAEAFVENIPNLAAIFLNDNNFLCHRSLEIFRVFRANGTDVNNFTLNSYTKKRDYLPGMRYGIICLTEAQQRIENMKRALTMSLDELKDYPIGKAVIQLKDVVQSELIEADRNILELFDALNKAAETNRQRSASLYHVGSQTFMDLLRRLSAKNNFHFHRDAVQRLETIRLAPDQQQELAEMITDLPTPSVYVKHVCYTNFTESVTLPIFCSFRSFDIVRDPVERVISWYYYVRAPWYYVERKEAFPDLPLPDPRWLRKDFETCVLQGDRECTNNEGETHEGIGDHRRQNLFFRGHSHECTPFNTVGALEWAKHAVESQYAVVGVLEDLNTTLSVFEKYVPRFFDGATDVYYDQRDSFNKINTNAFKPPVSERVKEIVRRNFTREIEFYQFCKQRLHKQYLAVNLPLK